MGLTRNPFTFKDPNDLVPVSPAWFAESKSTKFNLLYTDKIQLLTSRVSACEMNVHKRCERFVPPLCGVNARELGELLGKLGTSSHNLSSHSNKKMVSTTHFLVMFCFVVFYHDFRSYILHKMVVENNHFPRPVLAVLSSITEMNEPWPNGSDIIIAYRLQ